VALFGAPLTGMVANHVIPQRMLTSIEGSHASERLLIWQYFGDVARLRPWSGVGFNAADKLEGTALAAEVPEHYRQLLHWGHPHNAFLQVWVELGIPGVVLAAISLCLLFQWLAEMPKEDIPIRLAAVAAVAAIAIESHGAWQGWWLAGLGAQIILFVSFAKRHADSPG
jgi:O-antigen ligase